MCMSVYGEVTDIYIACYLAFTSVVLDAHTQRHMKLVYNEVLPWIIGIIGPLLPSPDQVLLQLDAQKYTEKLYGSAGPQYHSVYKANYLKARQQQSDDVSDTIVHVGDSDDATAFEADSDTDT